MICAYFYLDKFWLKPKDGFIKVKRAKARSY